jgi:hypothetical protein
LDLNEAAGSRNLIETPGTKSGNTNNHLETIAWNTRAQPSIYNQVLIEKPKMDSRSQLSGMTTGEEERFSIENVGNDGGGKSVGTEFGR